MGFPQKMTRQIEKKFKKRQLLFEEATSFYGRSLCVMRVFVWLVSEKSGRLALSFYSALSFEVRRSVIYDRSALASPARWLLSFRGALFSLSRARSLCPPRKVRRPVSRAGVTAARFYTLSFFYFFCFSLVSLQIYARIFFFVLRGWHSNQILCKTVPISRPVQFSLLPIKVGNAYYYFFFLWAKQLPVMLFLYSQMIRVFAFFVFLCFYFRLSHLQMFYLLSGLVFQCSLGAH